VDSEFETRVYAAIQEMMTRMSGGKKKRKMYGPEFKAKVELKAVRGVKTTSEIAQAHGVHPVMVGQWKKRIPAHAGAAAKLLYLALRNIEKDGKKPPVTSRQAANQSAILFGERFVNALRRHFLTGLGTQNFGHLADILQARQVAAVLTTPAKRRALAYAPLSAVDTHRLRRTALSGACRPSAEGGLQTDGW
jgi:transposase-like protein